MTYKQFAQLVTFLHDQDKFQTTWLDSLPPDIRSSFIDNKFYESLQKVNDRLLKESFTTEQFYDVTWFLYDVLGRDTPWVDNLKTSDNVKYTINTLDDFLAYARVELFGGISV